MAEKNNPVNWSEIPVNDMERASKFCEGVLLTVAVHRRSRSFDG